jgi:DNA primase
VSIVHHAQPEGRANRGCLKPIDAAKEAVPIEQLAERLSGEGKRRGREIAFICPLHDDHDPSLIVDPEKQVWFCHPCAVGGDVVELARLAWGHPDDGRGKAEAAAYLLMEFGHEVPQRPASWHRRQDRQQKVRDRLEEVKVRHVQRRLYRIFEPSILSIEEEAERQEEKAQVWDELRLVAVLVVDGRRGA